MHPPRAAGLAHGQGVIKGDPPSYIYRYPHMFWLKFDTGSSAAFAGMTHLRSSEYLRRRRYKHKESVPGISEQFDKTTTGLQWVCAHSQFMSVRLGWSLIVFQGIGVEQYYGLQGEWLGKHVFHSMSNFQVYLQAKALKGFASDPWRRRIYPKFLKFDLNY